jgi:C-terminal processing protease CtpA/Prc
MKSSLFQTLKRIALTCGAALITATLIGAAPAQDNPNAPNREAARDTAKAKVEAARETKQEARGEVRDGREGARDTAREDRQTTRNSREEARDTVGEERQTIRDARRDVRTARREFIASRIRSGDLGLFVRRMTDGLTVTDVATSGAISQSGLKEGDEIISINGQAVTTEREFVDQLFANQQASQPAQVVVKRNGQQMTLAVQTKAFIDEHMNSDDRLHDFGLILDQNDPNHVKVQAVVPRSPAFYAGVKSGDQITGFSGERVTRLADFIKSLANANNSTAQMDVNRNNQQRQLEIEVPGHYQAEQPRTALRPNLQDPNAAGQQRPAPAATRTPADAQPRLNPQPRQ